MLPETIAVDEARRASAFAGVDLRTLVGYLRGTRRTYRSTASNIERALRKIKRGDLVRTQSSAVR